MKRADEVLSESKLDIITHYLLRAFPGTEIVSREDDKDHLLTVCADGHGTKVLRIAKPFLRATHPTTDEIPLLFDQLEVVRLLSEQEEYALPFAIPTNSALQV